MNSRLSKILKKYLVIFLIGVAYLIWVLCTDIRIPCPIYTVTGLLCPGCGITRMIAALAKFDFTAAFSYNPFLFINGPILLFLIIYPDISYIKKGVCALGRFSFIAWIEIAMALIFAVLRNIL